MNKQMKKIIYILSAALVAFACTDRLEYAEPVIDETDEGAKIAIEFSLPPVTKGTMTHNPTISTIHVAVFNQAGVLKQYEKATLINPENLTDGNNTQNGNPKYSVEINMSTKKRILHFIADSPVDDFDSLVELAGTSGEDVILNALTTSAGATAYWQKVELDRIDAYVYDGGVYTTPDGINWGEEGGNSYSYTEAGQSITVYQGDYIKRNGKKILDGTGYFQSNYVRDLVANIPFVRNFAEITVSSQPDAQGGSNFIPKKFALVNVPKYGYVAPFDNRKREFCSAYIGVETITHATVSATNYPGSLAGSLDTSLPTTFIDLSSSNPDAYMYERTVPNTSQPATCILVAGQYDNDGNGVYNDNDGALRDGEGNTWFKIEIAAEDGTYFPIYRGVSYDILIGKISGSTGYASASDAYNNDPIGDISGSVTTASLEKINDGKGTTLWVEYTDYVGTQSETVTIYYTMFYQNGNQITYIDATPTVEHPDESYKAIVGSVSIDSGTFTTGTPDPSKNWKKATVTLAEPGGNPKHSILHIEGTSHVNRQMYRNVHYHVIGTQYFVNGENELTGTNLPDEDAGEITTLTIYLPNDLGMSMFPLDLIIEAQNGGFTSVSTASDPDGLPVESGPSLFDSSKNAFYFLKTINYDDYYDVATGAYTTAFTAAFKTTRDGTTTAAGTNATFFRVIDKVKPNRSTPYFAYAECYVGVGGPVFQLSSDGVSVKSDVISASFIVRSTGTENTEWTLTVNNGASLSDGTSSGASITGSGVATITVSFPENFDDTPKTYTVTATRTGFPNQTFTITQEKKTSKYYTINLDAGGNNGTYGYPWVSSTVNPDTSTYWSYQSDNYRQASTIATMSVTVYGYTEFTIYIRSYAEGNYDYIVVRNIGSNAITSWTANSSYNNSKDHTRGRQSGTTTINGYREVTFTRADDGLSEDDTPHTFYIQFGKDGSQNSNDDRGYVLIPREYTFVQ